MGLKNDRRGQQTGAFTPTLTAVSNVDTITPVRAWFVQDGNHVTVSFGFTINQTATGSAVFRCSLPPAARRLVTALHDIAGVAGSGTDGFAGVVNGDITTDEAIITLDSNSTADQPGSAVFTYLLEG
jgi:hypothetical protein